MLAYTVILFFFGYSFISPPFMCAPYIEFRITSGQGSVICWAGSFYSRALGYSSASSAAHRTRP